MIDLCQYIYMGKYIWWVLCTVIMKSKKTTIYIITATPFSQCIQQMHCQARIYSKFNGGTGAKQIYLQVSDLFDDTSNRDFNFSPRKSWLASPRPSNYTSKDDSIMRARLPNFFGIMTCLSSVLLLLKFNCMWCLESRQNNAIWSGATSSVMYRFCFIPLDHTTCDHTYVSCKPHHGSDTMRREMLRWRRSLFVFIEQLAAGTWLCEVCGCLRRRLPANGGSKLCEKTSAVHTDSK